MNSHGRQIARALQAEGWEITRTRTGHPKARHPQASRWLSFPGTPGDRNAMKTTLRAARRLLPQSPLAD